MSEKEFEQSIADHWAYTEKFILALCKWKDAPKIDDGLMEFMKFLYCEGMKHGYKHALNSGNETRDK
jgi:hypothetical protein